MTATAKKIEAQIKQLNLEEMLLIHERLIISIHEKEESIEPAFREQIYRRIDEIDSGKVKGVDALKALAKM